MNARARAVVHRRRTGRNDRNKEVRNLSGNKRRASRSQVAKRRYALPDDKRKRVGTLRQRGAALTDILLGFLLITLFVVLFGIGGCIDWQAEQAYKNAWAEANGIEQEVRNEAD